MILEDFSEHLSWNNQLKYKLQVNSHLIVLKKNNTDLNA